MSETPDAPEHLDIRKYPNRRYYDATRSRHLTLEEIRSLVRDGCDIKVTDSRTDTDITAQVLTQIILELDTAKLETFPISMLVQMIRANERVVTDFMQNYFDQAFSAYLGYQKQMEERFRQLHAIPETLNPFTAWSQSILGSFAPKNAAPPAPGQNKAAGEPDVSKTIAELQQQVAELRQQLKKRRR